MATEEVRIHRIAAHPSSIEPGQISLMSSDDADMGFRAMGHKAHNGDVLVALAKDQIARVAQLHGNTRLDFSDNLLSLADGGSGLSVRFADSMEEADDFLDDFGDVSVMAAMKYMFDNGAGVSLDGAHANGELITVNDGQSGVGINADVDANVTPLYVRTLNGATDKPTLVLQNASTADAPTIQFDGNAGIGASGHLLRTLNGGLSIQEIANETSPFTYQSEAYSRAYRSSGNPDMCTSYAELYSTESIGSSSASIRVRSDCGVDGADGASGAYINAPVVAITSGSSVDLIGRVAYRLFSALTPTSGNIAVDLDAGSARDIDFEDIATLTITLQEPEDSLSNQYRSYYTLRLIQGSATATTSITWASSGSATINWLTDSNIDETLDAETYVEIWWDYGKWTLMKPGSAGVSGLNQYQVLTGAADGGIAQSSNLIHSSNGNLTLASGSFKAITAGNGIEGISDAYNSEKILFGLGTMDVTVRDNETESASTSISLRAQHGATTADPQVEIVGGGAYSGSIAGTLNLSGYSMNIFAPTGVDFNSSRMFGITSAAFVEQSDSSASGYLSVDLLDGSAKVTVSENITSVSFQNARSGAKYELRLVFSGSYSVTGFSGTWKWSGAEPPISGASGDEFIVTFKYFGADGYRAMINEFV